jgi:membrane peptidoglycan carboxypeptidase
MVWLVLGLLVLFGLIVIEMRTSILESVAFTRLAHSMNFSMEPGRSPNFRHPHSGPYDIRLGHSGLTHYLERLGQSGFEIRAQARASPELIRLMDMGFYPVYGEKPQAGLSVIDRDGKGLFVSKWPQRIYPEFDAIPPVVVRTLAYIENREVLDASQPYKNPAVEWDRLTRATAGFWLTKVGLSGSASGGSTLATQIEKIRHSSNGVTRSAGDKARQMISASLRAYQGGRETLEARERVVCDYLNSMPLAAMPGYGEVHGLGDGLALWFGEDFDHVNRLLNRLESNVLEGRELAAISRAYRQVLSLLLAIRKPSGYLLSDRQALAARTDLFLDSLSQNGIIPVWLRDRARKTDLQFLDSLRPGSSASFADRKGVNAVRVELLRLLGLDSLYQLDRLDLTVSTTLDGHAQAGVTSFLQKLRNPEFAQKAGLRQHRLLEQADPSRVIYSVALYESAPDANLLRIKADNYDQPLDVNEGTKLELGSTAKLRTLVSYLEAIAALHKRLSGLPANELSALDVPKDDALTAWAREYLNRASSRRLEVMIDAALERRYSASPAEEFFTGGGLHQFSNFEPADDGRILSVREAFHRSVNLVFIRLMRDLVRHKSYQLPGASPTILEDTRNPARQQYLDRFVEMESRQYLSAFYREYGGVSPDVALQRLAAGIQKTPRRLAILYRSVFPAEGVGSLRAFLLANLGRGSLTDKSIAELYMDYSPGKLSRSDRAYLAGVHPLQIWLLEYKRQNPGAKLDEIMTASKSVRRLSYEWLLRSRQDHAPDRAIRIMLEADAFAEIHKAWQRLGYPFGRLVPSYATALGSSGDTPAALAELMGIILNDGVRKPTVRLDRIRFAAQTPFETVLAPQSIAGSQVLAAPVAEAVHRELLAVVERGTAVRASRAIVIDGGRVLPVGGKTGTGDNRFERFSRSGAVIDSRVTNRTATFVFLIGDRFYGTVTAFVPGEAANQYAFTSSLPVQVFRSLAPMLKSVISQAGAQARAPET